MLARPEGKMVCACLPGRKSGLRLLALETKVKCLACLGEAHWLVREQASSSIYISFGECVSATSVLVKHSGASRSSGY